MTATVTVSWAATELAGADLGDARLNRRLVRVAEQLGAQPSASIPVACGGWAETQAAYRLLAHENVGWESVLAPHWECSVERMHRHPVVLWVQDSTELDYTAQPGSAGLGPLSYLRQHGLYVHPTLAVTPDGVPLGVLDAWLWTRDRETFGEDKRHWPIEAKESLRWLEGFERCAELAATLPDTRLVYVADREGDIHEFMVRAQRWPSIDWLIRATHNRCLAKGDKLWDWLASAPVLGEVTFTLPARPNRPSRLVVLTVRAERVTLRPKGGEPVTVTALRAREESPPTDVEPLDWRLLTNRPVDTLAHAAELLQWYTTRWSIGVSGEGHITQSVPVRPRPKDSSLVAGEAPWRESKTVKPSDPVHRGCTATHQVVTCRERRSSLVTRYSGGRDGRSRAKAAGADRNEPDTAAPTGGVSAATGCEGGWVNRRSPRCPTKKTCRGGASYNREREVAAWAPGWRIGS
jgi:hypothetical protein